MQARNSHIIVIGNEKGGAGKTTTSMHLIMSLLHLGFKVSSIDIDCRQKSLSRYLENRSNYALKRNIALLQPNHFSLAELGKAKTNIKQAAELRPSIELNSFVALNSSIALKPPVVLKPSIELRPLIELDIEQKIPQESNNAQEQITPKEQIIPQEPIITSQEQQALENKAKLDQLNQIIDLELNTAAPCDFLLIDTPGSNTFISSYAHSLADTIITPINDSFVDLDVIAQIDADNLQMIKPNFYAQAIWEQKINKAKNGQGEINWIVLRNRLSAIDARNKQKMEKVLENISTRLGFRVVSGFNERVIYRELFLHGLTLLDLKAGITDITLNISHIAAKQELNNFLRQLNITKLNEALAKGYDP